MGCHGGGCVAVPTVVPHVLLLFYSSFNQLPGFGISAPFPYDCIKPIPAAAAVAVVGYVVHVVLCFCCDSAN